MIVLGIVVMNDGKQVGKTSGSIIGQRHPRRTCLSQGQFFVIIILVVVVVGNEIVATTTKFVVGMRRIRRRKWSKRSIGIYIANE